MNENEWEWMIKWVTQNSLLIFETNRKSRKFQFLWKSQDDAGVKNRSNSVSDAESQSKSRSKFFTMRFGSKKNK